VVREFQLAVILDNLVDFAQHLFALLATDGEEEIE
jgi:hypothetical protein